MKTTIDAVGRLVIPKELRREAGLQPGSQLEIRWRQGLIENRTGTASRQAEETWPVPCRDAETADRATHEREGRADTTAAHPRQGIRLLLAPYGQFSS